MSEALPAPIGHHYGVNFGEGLAGKIAELAADVLAEAASRANDGFIDALTPERQEEHRAEIRKLMTVWCTCGHADCSIARGYGAALSEGLRIGSLVGMSGAPGALPSKSKRIRITRGADGSSTALISEYT
jgi:hypothetical protein